MAIDSEQLAETNRLYQERHAKFMKALKYIRIYKFDEFNIALDSKDRSAPTRIIYEVMEQIEKGLIVYDPD